MQAAWWGSPGSRPAFPQPETEPERRQLPLRRPLPPMLGRVDNPTRVPDAERPCPICGKERTYIGHDLTEVVDLIPAEAIVRRHPREKLACVTYEAERVRAPNGDEVVAGGRRGSRLVVHR